MRKVTQTMGVEVWPHGEWDLMISKFQQLPSILVARREED